MAKGQMRSNREKKKPKTSDKHKKGQPAPNSMQTVAAKSEPRKK